ncbi:MAG: shikimate kinase [Anaerovoracaceae bacterium]
MKKNIILVGMPACGKSVIGVVLAKTIQKKFLDTDLIIQERENLPLQEIINNEGNDYFKKAEEEVLSTLNTENTVIATGGSAIYYPGAMEYLKKNGQVIYLKVSLKTIKGRLHNIKTRGVTLGKGETIDGLYQRRIPLYEKYADITIETENLTVEESVTKIVNTINPK